MTAWPSQIDARIFMLAASGTSLGVISANVGRPLGDVTLRAVEIGAIAADAVPSVDVVRMPWPADWQRPRCSDELAAQAALCRRLWGDVFRAVVTDEIDQILQLEARDPVALLLRGYLSQQHAADVLYLAGIDPDAALPRLRMVARRNGLPALRAMLACIDHREAGTR